MNRVCGSSLATGQSLSRLPRVRGASQSAMAKLVQDIVPAITDKFNEAVNAAQRAAILRESLQSTLGKRIKEQRVGMPRMEWKFGVVKNQKKSQLGTYGLASASAGFPRLSALLGAFPPKRHGTCVVSLGGEGGVADLRLQARDLVPRHIAVIPTSEGATADALWSHAAAFQETGKEVTLVLGKFVSLNGHKPYTCVPKGSLCWKLEYYDAVSSEDVGAIVMAGLAGTSFEPPTAGFLETHAKEGMTLERHPKTNCLVAKVADAKFLVEAASRAYLRAHPKPAKQGSPPQQRMPKRGYCEVCQCAQCADAKRIVAQRVTSGTAA